MLKQPAVTHGIDDAMPVVGPRSVDPHLRRVQDRLLDGYALLRDKGLGIGLKGLLLKQTPMDRGAEYIDSDVKSWDSHGVLFEVKAAIGSQDPRSAAADDSLPLLGFVHA